jgi:hypothetical protein
MLLSAGAVAAPGFGRVVAPVIDVPEGPRVLFYLSHNPKAAGRSFIDDFDWLVDHGHMDYRSAVSCFASRKTAEMEAKEFGDEGESKVFEFLVQSQRQTVISDFNYFDWEAFRRGECQFAMGEHGPKTFEAIFYQAARGHGLETAAVRSFVMLRDPMEQVVSHYAHAHMSAETNGLFSFTDLRRYAALAETRSRDYHMFAKWDAYNFQTNFLAPTYPIIPLGSSCPNMMNNQSIPPATIDMIEPEPDKNSSHSLHKWERLNHSLTCARRWLSLPEGKLSRITNAINIQHAFSWGHKSLTHLNLPTFGPNEASARMPAQLEAAQETLSHAGVVGVLDGRGYSGFMCLMVEQLKGGGLPPWCSCEGGFNSSGNVPTWSNKDYGYYDGPMPTFAERMDAIEVIGRITTFDAMLVRNASTQFQNQLNQKGLYCMGTESLDTPPPGFTYQAGSWYPPKPVPVLPKPKPALDEAPVPDPLGLGIPA